MMRWCLEANVSPKVVKDRLEPEKKQDKKSYCKKLLNNLGRKKEITLSRNFETKMKVPSLKVGAQRLRFIWKHGVQKGSKGTHLENPINFRALLTGKSAFKVLFHHAITPRIDIFDFISDRKQVRKSENQTLGWGQLGWHKFLLAPSGALIAIPTY